MLHSVWLDHQFWAFDILESHFLHFRIRTSFFNIVGSVTTSEKLSQRRLQLTGQMASTAAVLSTCRGDTQCWRSKTRLPDPPPTLASEDESENEAISQGKPCPWCHGDVYHVIIYRQRKKMLVYWNTKYYFTDFHKGQTWSKSWNCLISTTKAHLEERWHIWRAWLKNLL